MGIKGKRSEDVTWAGLIKRERCLSVSLSWYRRVSIKIISALKKGS